MKERALLPRRIVHHADFERVTNGFGGMFVHQRSHDCRAEPSHDESAKRLDLKEKITARLSMKSQGGISMGGKKSEQ